MRNTLFAGLTLAILGWSAVGLAWDPDETADLEAAAAETIAELLKADPGMQRFFDSAAGYAIYPTVGKAGFGIGGARGKGLLVTGGETVALTTLTQLSIGFQAGGQAYSEIIFFEDSAAFDDFRRGNFELGAQVSAVALKTGASADAEFNSGLAIFTATKGGLMYEASVSGQKFKIKELAALCMRPPSADKNSRSKN